MKKSPATTSLLGALLLALLLSHTSFGQANYNYNYKVGTVTVEGNEAVEQSLILSVSGLHHNMQLSATAVQEAIRRIYALGLFADVRIDVEYAGGMANLKIVVKEHPKLESVTFQGNKNIGDDDLKKKINIFERQTVSPNQIKQAVEAIRKAYQDKGYHEVQITPERQLLNDGRQLALTFKIKEGQKVKIRAIEFFGNKFFSADKLRGKMDAAPKGFLRSGSFKPDQYKKDKEDIIDFYKKNGFIDASIERDSVVVDPDGKNLVIKIWVNEGSRYYFGDVTFTGNEVYSDDFLLHKMKFHKGDVYDSEKYEDSFGEIYSAYQERGYLHVRVYDNQQTVDSLLNIEFEISEGVPAHINKIFVEGNTKTKEKVIRRELHTRPGQIFSRTLLMRSLRNVMLLNYFSDVEPDVKDLPNGDVDLVVKVKEKPTGQIQAGAGYSGQDKLVGTLGLGIPNFRGNGQNVSLDWTFGARRNSIALSFTEPWMFGTPTLFGTDLYNTNHLIDLGSNIQFTEQDRGLGLKLGRRLSWPDDYFQLVGRYTLQEFRYYDFTAEYDSAYAGDPADLNIYGGRFLTTSALGLTISRDSRNLPQFATSGSLVSLNSEVSGWALGGDWKYYKSVLDAAKYTRIFWKIALVTKMHLGVIDSPLGDKGIPYSERFAPGGTYADGEIRGYDDGTVGPTNERGGLLRGRSVLVYNVELQIPVVDQQIYGLLFADAGNAWLTGRAIKPFDLDRVDGLKKSVGAGFRVVVPGLGTIGFDFGYGYNNPNGAGWKPHFQIGKSF